MMKKSFLLSGVVLIIAFISTAQDSSLIVKHKIAIFAPLYLDSAFDESNEYKYAKNIFPKFINSGLEFMKELNWRLTPWTKKAPN